MRTKNQLLRDYFKNKNLPDHYPEYIKEELGLWAKHHKEEDVEIYDIFILKNKKRVLVNEIRKIQKHAIDFDIYEYVDRNTNEVFYFHEIETRLVED